MEKERVGELYIAGEAVLWGIFPVVTAISVLGTSPLYALAWTTLFSTGFFAVLVTVRKKWQEVFSTKALRDILLATFFVGILYYALTFIGVKFTSPGNVALLALSETFFAYLFFSVWKKETFPRSHLAGSLLMVVGAGIVLYPNAGTFHFGDILIVLAAAVAPFGNFFQRRAREHVSSETIMFIRSLVSAVVVFAIAWILHEPAFPLDTGKAVALLAVNGVFFMGLSKIFWIEGVHRISVTKANALNGAAPLVTLLCAYFILGTAPTIWQASALVPMFFGVLLLSKSEF